MSVYLANPETINQASADLRSGKLVAFPTETVYGLGGNASSDDAIRAIYAAKGRPSTNPLIVHVPDLETARRYGDFNDMAIALAQNFWPGPLTLIVPRKAKSAQLSKLVSAGLDTVALRVPSHPTAQKLLRACGCPVAAPSANISGKLSPTSAQHVSQDLSSKVSMIIADGAAKIGLESTVIDVSGDVPILLRHGAITLESAASITPDIIYHYISADGSQAVQSPGLLLKHYAPDKPVRLKAVDLYDGEALLAFGSTRFISTKNIPENYIVNLSEQGDLEEAAHNLFAGLHTLDKTDACGIAVMDIPNVGIGMAINDRLTRAAQR